MTGIKPRAQQFESRSSIHRSHLITAFAALCLLVIAEFAQGATNGEVGVAWDPVAGAAGYKVHHRNGSDYGAPVLVSGTFAKVSGLQAGVTYSFSAQACEENWTNCGDLSEEITTTIPLADFTASPLSGEVNLTVTFSCLASQGDVLSCDWDFGDGETSTAMQAVHTYTEAGSYTVALTANGEGGAADEEVKTDYIQVTAPPPVEPPPVEPPPVEPPPVEPPPVEPPPVEPPAVEPPAEESACEPFMEDELPMEFGELPVNYQWTPVKLTRCYSDPIVVAKPLSMNDPEDNPYPAVVRIDRTDDEGQIDKAGFRIRKQEWEYLTNEIGNAVQNGVQLADETVSYVVMERGLHVLSNGALVLAGRVETNKTNRFSGENFVTPDMVTEEMIPVTFNRVPVMLAAITSVNEADAVATRLRYITTTGFQVGMEEEENRTQVHATETIDYLALEPSFGLLNGFWYEADRLPDMLTHVAQSLIYRTTLTQPPMVLADMQTTAGGDTANLRWRNRTEVGVDLWVAEEQSKNSEMRHVGESIGYLVIEPTPEEAPTTPPEEEPETPSVCATPCSLWDATTTPSLVTDPDTASVELGMKFRAEVDGLVTGVRFYKGPRNTGTHVGRLWSSSGQLLAQATFTSETASGWQQVDFASPVAIQPNTTYVVSYYAPVAQYSVDEWYFQTDYTNGPLRALADGEDGSNGVYRYGPGGGFPTSTWRSGNYWVDVVFQTE